MDPRSGIIYEQPAIDALKDQLRRTPHDKALNRFLRRLMLLTMEEAAALIETPVRDRIEWARQRNERKRANRARRGK